MTNFNSDRLSAAGRQVPWHERFAILGWFRKRIRNTFFGLSRKAVRTDEGKEILANSLQNLLDWRPRSLPSNLDLSQCPYPDLGRSSSEIGPSLRKDAIIITARFRSGSTLLWTLFRTVPGFTSYYEPFNDRRC